MGFCYALKHMYLVNPGINDYFFFNHGSLTLQNFFKTECSPYHKKHFLKVVALPTFPFCWFKYLHYTYHQFNQTMNTLGLLISINTNLSHIPLLSTCETPLDTLQLMVHKNSFQHTNYIYFQENQLPVTKFLCSVTIYVKNIYL
jgi:hypothetical protein